MTLLYDALTAYLSPLLRKHSSGKVLAWEDLASSYAAANAVTSAHSNYFVNKKVADLHNAQVEAYREAAAASLQRWAQSVSLEPMEDHDSKEEFVSRCVSKATASIPKWQMTAEQRTATLTALRGRAQKVYAKYHPATTNGNNSGGSSANSAAVDIDMTGGKSGTLSRSSSDGGIAEGSDEDAVVEAEECEESEEAQTGDEEGEVGDDDDDTVEEDIAGLASVPEDQAVTQVATTKPKGKQGRKNNKRRAKGGNAGGGGAKPTVRKANATAPKKGARRRRAAASAAKNN